VLFTFRAVPLIISSKCFNFVQALEAWRDGDSSELIICHHLLLLYCKVVECNVDTRLHLYRTWFLLCCLDRSQTFQCSLFSRSQVADERTLFDVIWLHCCFFELSPRHVEYLGVVTETELIRILQHNGQAEICVLSWQKELIKCHAAGVFCWCINLDLVVNELALEESRFVFLSADVTHYCFAFRKCSVSDIYKQLYCRVEDFWVWDALWPDPSDVFGDLLLYLKERLIPAECHESNRGKFDIFLFACFFLLFHPVELDNKLVLSRHLIEGRYGWFRDLFAQSGVADVLHLSSSVLECNQLLWVNAIELERSSKLPLDIDDARVFWHLQLAC